MSPWRAVVPWMLAAVLGGVVVGRATSPPRIVVEHAAQVVQLDDDRYLVSHRWVERVIRTSHIVPDVYAANIVGLRLVDPSAALDAIGVREDDVLVAVDTHWLGEPDGAAEAWRAATTLDHFGVVVRRRGVFRRIDVEVSD